jgi:hypothetical protein
MKVTSIKHPFWLIGIGATFAATFLVLTLTHWTREAPLLDNSEWAGSTPQEAHAKLVKNLEGRGLDPNRVRSLDFSLVFRDWKSDLAATREAHAAGFDVEAYESPEAGFLFILRVKTKPASDACRRYLSYLFDVAERYDAAYTGWSEPQ